MIRRMVLAATCALVLAVPFTAGAQDITGTIVRVDPDAHVIVLDDNRMFRVTEDGGAVMIDNRPVELHTLRPGSRVVIHSGQPVAFQNGQYVVISQPVPAAGTTTVTTVTTAPATTVTTTAATPGAPMVIQDKVNGTITRYDAANGVVVFDDGRTYLLGPSAVAMVNGQPIPSYALRPGLAVTLSSVNPVVYRDGRYVLMNEGFRDMNGSTFGPDAKWSGYEADVSDAGMQIQS